MINFKDGLGKVDITVGPKQTLGKTVSLNQQFDNNNKILTFLADVLYIEDDVVTLSLWAKSNQNLIYFLKYAKVSLYFHLQI